MPTNDGEGAFLCPTDLAGDLDMVRSLQSGTEYHMSRRMEALLTYGWSLLLTVELCCLESVEVFRRVFAFEMSAKASDALAV